MRHLHDNYGLDFCICCAKLIKTDITKSSFFHLFFFSTEVSRSALQDVMANEFSISDMKYFARGISFQYCAIINRNAVQNANLTEFYLLRDEHDNHWLELVDNFL